MASTPKPLQNKDTTKQKKQEQIKNSNTTSQPIKPPVEKINYADAVIRNSIMVLI